MKATLKWLQITNWKGIENLRIDFGQVTNISGENGTGKTSVADAYSWLQTGKDTLDRKDFEIKPRDTVGGTKSNLESEVAAGWDFDGQEVILRRIYKEKWEKKRGDTVPTYTGNETKFLWNDVPLSQTEFKKKLDDLIPEKLWKLVTNPIYFNETLPWTERRTVLTHIAGDVSNDEIFKAIETTANRDQVASLMLVLQSGKTLAEYKKEIAAKKAKLKEEGTPIPARIEELNRTMPTLEDYTGIEAAIATKKAEIAALDKQISDSTTVYSEQLEGVRAKQRELNELQQKYDKAKGNRNVEKNNRIAAVNNVISKLELSKQEKNIALQAANRRIATHQTNIKQYEADNDKTRAKLQLRKEENIIIDPNNFVCPTCKRDIEAADKEAKIAELTATFNTNKANDVAALRQNGLDKKRAIELAKENLDADTKASEQLVKDIEDLDAQILEQQKQKASIEQEDAPETEEEKVLAKEIADFIVPPTPATVDTSAITNNKASLQSEIDALNNKLGTKATRETMAARVLELEAREKEVSQQIANLERDEFVIEAFSKEKIEAIEKAINGKFKYVTFKMFNQQVNGGETEACEVMVKGVPYGSVNTAGRINAGLDVINALSEHYNIFAPVFIDNRESINELIPCKSQLVNLRVSYDKQLKIN